MSKLLFALSLILFPLLCQADNTGKIYSLWYDRPAFNRGGDYSKVVSRGYPFDEDWERWSLPIGNGYMGANIFGRTDVERIQLSEKTIGNKGCYGAGGLTSFAEIYLDINHNHAKDYKRELRLNDAVSTVTYSYEGINYYREYFANYPDNVIVIKLKADKSGNVSFRLRPIFPYLQPVNENKTGRTGLVEANGDLITMEGNIQYFNLDHECQIKVINYGGSINAEKDIQGKKNTIVVSQADSAVIFIAAATSYQLKDSLFFLPPLEKFRGNEHPHRQVSERINKAVKKGYESLLKEHIADHSHYFNRVDVSLTNETPNIPTDQLLKSYKEGKSSPYLEELFFQYGRYLLIASSRAGALPPHLQGGWNQYEYAPWSGGYWHNINIQMNYWPAFNTNLSELFVPYVQYNEAFRKTAVRYAVNYVKRNNPEALNPIDEENGWTIGTGATAFSISGAGGHSGPGTGGFTTKLFWDYYDFTRDLKILEDHSYPAILGMAKFLSKTLKPISNGILLVNPSSSPEQRHNGTYYQTIGCAFDQGMVWENYKDLLEAAKTLNKKEPFLNLIKEQIEKLDPIQVGESGQIKEYREEKKYSDIGEPHHRHISHLCPLYPGTLINSTTPEWLEAARVSLDKRGDITNGWSMAHRLNSWARIKDGDRAYQLYRLLLTMRVTENLLGSNPPFTIEENFGATAGMAEMLLQSHEGYIEPLAALPARWASGHYRGLVARGNFEVSVWWENGKASKFDVLSRKGSTCRIKYPGITLAKMTDIKGKSIKYRKIGEDIIEFNTKQDNHFLVEF